MPRNETKIEEPQQHKEGNNLLKGIAVSYECSDSSKRATIFCAATFEIKQLLFI
jgi:hypothetical protein